jgi:hypothetical protein
MTIIRNDAMKAVIIGYRMKETAMKGKCNDVITRKNENGVSGKIVKKSIMKK